MVAVSWVMEESVVVRVTGEEPTNLVIQILVTVVIDVSERNAVSLLQVAETAASTDIFKALPIRIAEHDVGHDCLVVWVACADIDIKKTVVVEITEVRAHW